MAQIDYPDWAVDTENNGTGNTPNKVAATPLKVSKGWGFPEKPPRGEFNYWMNLVGKWVRSLYSPVYYTRADTYAALVGDRILPNNSGGALTINLPVTPTEGDTLYFRQVRGDLFSVNSLTIGRNGETIMDIASDLVVTTDNIEFEMYYSGTTWEIIITKTVGI